MPVTGPGRRTTLLAAAASATTFGPAAASGAEASLAQLAWEKGILFGTMATLDLLEESPILLPEAITRDARIVVPGLELKWDKLRPAPDRFDFSRAEAMLAFAERQGLPSKGHTLVWHEALPRWFNLSPTRDEAQALLRTHISTVGRHFAGRLHSWDVVNEVIQPHEGHPQGLRNTPFLRALGPDYIEEAFELAAAADPRAIRVLNEFNLEMDNSYQEARRRAMLALLERLVRRGAPIDALGIQAHLVPRQAPFRPEIFRRFLRDVASLGLRIQFTELDIQDRFLPADIGQRDAMAATAIGEVLAVALAEPAVDLVTLWGLSDRGSYMSRIPDLQRRDGKPQRPHLYDEAFLRKPAWHAVAQAFRAAPQRSMRPTR
ncbi:endo-1,4-beta-xylanase [Roseococcus pinisoli]|uniref:Beta-xylanase n=1 Tax=Roseococcus pinisoli TaxID=2835040 RepID=A0ABS5QDF7_9PROT|nr:endo-1,4-beta-xylanase [Roseococcus pinisoli]MBS7811737.1 endo-1,4-beta-xylanase [Roseococcus pinisoli]